MVDYNVLRKFSGKNPKRHELLRLWNILMSRGINLDGTILELGVGSVSLGYFFRGVLSIDIDPQVINELKRDGIPGIVADIYNLPLKDKSFDHVVAINPPINQIFINTDRGDPLGDGTVRFSNIRDEAICRLVEIMFRIARESVLIISDIIPSSYSDLPFKEKIEKYCPEPSRSVLYNTTK